MRYKTYGGPDACGFPTALYPHFCVRVSIEGLWLQELLLSPAALVSATKWLKQGSEFITSGQCNYLGTAHVTGINMTQSAYPLTLIHDKVRWCLSVERSALLDSVRPLLFDLLLGHCNIIKEPLFYKTGK